MNKDQMILDAIDEIVEVLGFLHLGMMACDALAEEDSSAMLRVFFGANNAARDARRGLYGALGQRVPGEAGGADA